MIPDFVHYPDAPDVSSLLLPDGVWPCTFDEIEQKLVNEFPASRTRARVFDGLQIYLRDCQRCGLSGRIWLDGSFVTGKNEPNDVDVLCLVRDEIMETLADAEFALSLLDGGDATRTRYDVHSFGVVAVAASDVHYIERARLFAGWLKFLRKTKRFAGADGGLMQLPKGVLELDFGESSQTQEIERWIANIPQEIWP